ncbi:hypothetical protein GIB67_033708 [Kingdonia uniflora]|uniref:NAD-dependent epimerase/dehydratase domain-containing protein n=1 Tax=Kingdonia uniflora TaxID=39325 RepID=A0A7J7P3Z9_9MAGN|nr:hypothetical protein GIB67_033708 [Kingdonia uniflora]
MEKERVCVTGAGGYQASWVVKLLLSKGYIVHGTVRQPSDEKNAHLNNLENATENLQLFKADLLDYEGLCAAIAGCTGVFHVASPVIPYKVENPQVQLLEPAVTGTLNVLKASVEAKVKKVIVVSSIAAVQHNPNWPKDKVMDESCWSDKEHCKKIESWYSISKTEAETQAFEFAKKSNLDIVTVCPSIIVGPMLQPTMNASSQFIPFIMKGGYQNISNELRMFVDVRDVAEALLLVYLKPEAEGRYICLSHTVKTQEFQDKLMSLYPNYKYGNTFKAPDEDCLLSSEKLQKLGWKFRSFEETLVDAVQSYQKKGILETLQVKVSSGKIN